MHEKIIISYSTNQLQLESVLVLCVPKNAFKCTIKAANMYDAIHVHDAFCFFNKAKQVIW